MATSRLPIFTERFTLLRGERTQANFADYLGFSRPTVALYESGARIPDIVALKQIAEKCNVSADYLLGLSDAPTNIEEEKVSSEYTGLSVDAIRTMNKAVFLRKDKCFSEYFDYFSEFIVHFYSSFFSKLGHVGDDAACAAEALDAAVSDGNLVEMMDEINMRIDSLQKELYVFSEECRKIPRYLFDTENILEAMERKAAKLEAQFSDYCIQHPEKINDDIPF